MEDIPYFAVEISTISTSRWGNEMSPQSQSELRRLLATCMEIERN